VVGKNEYPPNGGLMMVKNPVGSQSVKKIALNKHKFLTSQCTLVSNLTMIQHSCGKDCGDGRPPSFQSIIKDLQKKSEEEGLMLMFLILY